MDADVSMSDVKDGIDIARLSAQSKFGKDRMRCLWPPLGPAVAGAFEWTKEEASKKPMLAVALGMTLWPAAVVTALVGTPMVVADNVVQHVYNSLSEGPIVETLERGAAQAFHAGKLSMLTGKLVLRHSVTIATRQIERRGGVGEIAKDVGGFVLDRATHPVETVCMTWDVAGMGFRALGDAVGHVKDTVEREMDKNKASRLQ
mmetsp:Transcript_11765/g.17279  ORF Transcript_11765/g.17279 Transcript_11765/m.17279 type:complete len:203 (+) Transcript_11765:587-1195(+)